MQGLFSFRSGLTTLIAATGAALLLLFPAQAAEPVDVELVLAVDVSLSMSPMELDIQRRGYAEALTHDAVLQAIQEGVHGKIAVTYFEWAGDAMQQVVVPWTVIASKEDAEAFTRKLSARPPASARRTSISGALSFGADLFAESGFAGMKRVIDISGDGPNNQGMPVVSIRDQITNQGITINGLPLMTNSGYGGGFDMADLDIYYTNCVIGGPGAFMVPVNEWSQFPEAIRRKLVLELAEAPVLKPQRATFDGEAARVWLAQAQTNGPPQAMGDDGAYDCQIGEKLWGNRSWMWDSR